MSGVYKLKIEESEDDLKKLLRQQKTGSGKERIQLLYLLKTKQAETIQAAAALLGRHRVTVQKWLRTYRKGGITKLLATQTPTGRPRAIPSWAEAALQKRLMQPGGFRDYQEICDWLKSDLGIKAKYKTVHKLVHERLQASPKIPRPVSVEQSTERREDYKKNSVKTWQC